MQGNPPERRLSGEMKYVGRDEDTLSTKSNESEDLINFQESPLIEVYNQTNCYIIYCLPDTNTDILLPLYKYLYQNGSTTNGMSSYRFLRYDSQDLRIGDIAELLKEYKALVHENRKLKGVLKSNRIDIP